MGSPVDATRRNIALTEERIASLGGQIDSVERELNRLGDIRSRMMQQRAVFFEDLARRRQLASRASGLTNVASAQRFGERMSDAYGSKFEGGVDGELTSLVRDVDSCIHDMRNRLDELRRQLKAVESQLAQQYEQLKVEIARQEA